MLEGPAPKIRLQVFIFVGITPIICLGILYIQVNCFLFHFSLTARDLKCSLAGALNIMHWYPQMSGEVKILITRHGQNLTPLK